MSIDGPNIDANNNAASLHDWHTHAIQLQDYTRDTDRGNQVILDPRHHGDNEPREEITSASALVPVDPSTEPGLKAQQFPVRKQQVCMFI